MNNYCYTCMNELDEYGICPQCRCANHADDVIYRLKPGTILNHKFLVGNCLGEGGFGITYIGRDLTLDIRVAIKEFFPNGYVNRNHNITQLVAATTENKSSYFQKGRKNFLEEARRIARLTDVPGIVDVREYFEENNTAYIIMEYLNGVNLSSYLKQNGIFSPEKIFELMYPITKSLETMHEEGIIHRDISPDNIMYLKNGTLKLMDFGSARYFTNSQKEMSVMIKQGYAPEEQYSENGDQGPWTDVYGLCATMYRCITGVVPDNAIDRIRSDTMKSPAELGVPISEAMNNTLMYGLAVFKNDRCKDMRELSYLMDSAMNNNNAAFNNGNDYYQRVNRTINANTSSVYQNGYPEQYPINQPTTGRNPDSYARNPAQTDHYNNYERSYQPASKGSNKNAVIISITIFLCIAMIAGTVLFIFLNKNDTKDADLIETSAPVTQAPATAAPVTIFVTEAHIEPETEAPRFVIPPTEPETPTSPPEPTSAPEPTTPPSSSTLAFSSASASSQLKKEYVKLTNEWKYYDPENVLKNDDTCWAEGADGFGIGESITLDLAKETKLSGIKIINGYAGNESQYKKNAKVTKAELEFSDGSTVIKELKVYDPSERKTVQTLTFDPIETTSVKITILEVETAECEDTCITYVAPYVS